MAIAALVSGAGKDSRPSSRLPQANHCNMRQTMLASTRIGVLLVCNAYRLATWYTSGRSGGFHLFLRAMPQRRLRVDAWIPCIVLGKRRAAAVNDLCLDGARLWCVRLKLSIRYLRGVASWRILQLWSKRKDSRVVLGSCFGEVHRRCVVSCVTNGEAATDCRTSWDRDGWGSTRTCAEANLWGFLQGSGCMPSELTCASKETMGTTLRTFV